MKKAILLSVGLALFLSACALFHHRGQRIAWPEQITYMEATCDLDLSWKGMKYRGSMTLIMNYPSQLQMEVYGPFGDTIMFLKKDDNDFLLVTKEERYRDSNLFEERFGIRLQEFMEDIVMISEKDTLKKNQYSIQRPGYTVFYTLKDSENTICWKGENGTICIKFLEVTFGQEVDSLEESNS